MDYKKLVLPQGGSGTSQPASKPTALYAVTVTDGDRSIRYEAPTMEEAQRMAMNGVPQMVYSPPAKDDDTVEIVTLTEQLS